MPGGKTSEAVNGNLLADEMPESATLFKIAFHIPVGSADRKGVGWPARRTDAVATRIPM